MTINRLRFVTALALVGLTFTGARAQEGEQAEPQGFDQAAMEKMWEEYATPGPEHEQFQKLVGEWKTEGKSYWPDPDNPQVSHGTATFKLLMGGRYLQESFQGEHEGQTFEGMAIAGYAIGSDTGIRVPEYRSLGIAVNRYNLSRVLDTTDMMRCP